MRTAISNNSDTEIMNMPSPRAPQCRRIVAVKCLDVHQASWSEKGWRQADDGQTDGSVR